MPQKGLFNDSRGMSDNGDNGEVMTEARLTRLETQHTAIMSSLIRIEARLDQNFVTHAEFWPVRAIVYCGAGTVLLGVLGAVVTLVIRNT